MGTRSTDPHRLDVESFAAEGGELDGRWPLRGFDRVAELAMVGTDDALGADVAWRVRGGQATSRGSAREYWLQVQGATELSMQCQRCLLPVRVPLEVDQRIVFVHGEAAAAELDAEREEDVLALSRALDLHELIEDELLLALPLVPMHEACPVPVSMSGSAAPGPEDISPFAVLESLKRSGPAD